MMKTETGKKVIISVDSDVHQGNVKNVRRGLKTIQPSATDKENIAGRLMKIKDSKVTHTGGSDVKKPKPLLVHQETQTEKYITNIDDLTGEEPSAEYWKRLAEKRQESLDDSLHEIEKLKGDISVLQEENKICKEMLDESKNLVEVLQEMLQENDEDEEEEVSGVGQDEDN